MRLSRALIALPFLGLADTPVKHAYNPIGILSYREQHVLASTPKTTQNIYPRDNYFDVMSSSGQEQLSSSNSQLMSPEARKCYWDELGKFLRSPDPQCFYSLTESAKKDLQKSIKYQNAGVLDSTIGVLEALARPDFDSFPEAYAEVIPFMGKSSRNTEVPRVSWDSREGRECPHVWNKQDNNRSDIRRFAIFASGPEHRKDASLISEKIQDIFNVPESNIAFAKNPKQLRNQMKQIGKKVEEAQRNGYRPEILISLSAHGKTDLPLRNPFASGLKQARSHEGGLEGYLEFDRDNFSATDFQNLLDRHMPKGTKGLVWVNACNSGAWQKVGSKNGHLMPKNEV